MVGGDADTPIEADKTYTVSVDGRIVPRHIHFQMNDKDHNGLVKAYDGSKEAYVNDVLTDGRLPSYLAYAHTTDYPDEIVKDEILNRYPELQIKAVYDTPNVKREGTTSDSEVSHGKHDVKYTLNLSDDLKKDYILDLDGKTEDERRTQTLDGKGTITPIELKVTAEGQVYKTYDGNTNIAYDTNESPKYVIFTVNDTTGKDLGLSIDSTKVQGTFLATATTEDKDVNRFANAETGEVKNDENGDAYYYKPILFSGLRNALKSSNAGVGENAPDWNYTVADTLAVAENDKMAYIKPKALTATVSKAEKEFDGTTTVKNPDENVVFTGIVDKNQTIAPFTVTSGTYYDAANRNLDANAGVEGDADGASKKLRAHTVRYEIQKNAGSGNYVLDNVSYRNSNKAYITGDGTITRRHLVFKSGNSSMTVGGQPDPALTGTVTGWTEEKDAVDPDHDAYKDDPSVVLWDTDPIGTRSEGKHTVYGWYKYDSEGSYRQKGNYGTNYTFSQEEKPKQGVLTVTKGTTDSGGNTGGNTGGNPGGNPSHPTNPTNPTNPTDPSHRWNGHEVPWQRDDFPRGMRDDRDTMQKFTPDHEAYNDASNDTFGSVMRRPMAGLHYQSGGTQLGAEQETVDYSAMDVTGVNGVVNLGRDFDMQTQAGRIDLTQEAADFTVAGGEYVPVATQVEDDETTAVISTTTTSADTSDATVSVAG